MNLAIFAPRATLLDLFARVNWTKLVILQKWLVFCLKILVGHALQLTKGGLALKLVEFWHFSMHIIT